MNSLRNRLLYPLIFAAVASVATFGGIGVAAITGHLSVAQGGFELFLPTAMADERFTAVATPASIEPSYTGLTRKSGADPLPATKPFEYRRGQRLNHAKHSCSACGVVQSIEPRVQQQSPDNSNAAQSAASAELGGGVLKAAMVSTGNSSIYSERQEHSLEKSYVVRVRMEDGSFRTIHEHQRPPFSIGERVKLVNGSVVSIG